MRYSGVMGPLPTTYEGWLARAREQEQRFRSKILVTDGGCHLWQGGVDKDGYGKFQITGRGARFVGDPPVQKHVRSHKLAWELVNGPVPAGNVLRHSCDTPACCNPEHLEPGSQAQNRADAIARGREPRGESKWQAVLTEVQALEVRRRALTGERHARIAGDFGISPITVSAIKAGRIWKHLWKESA